MKSAAVPNGNFGCDRSSVRACPPAATYPQTYGGMDIGPHAGVASEEAGDMHGRETEEGYQIVENADADTGEINVSHREATKANFHLQGLCRLSPLGKIRALKNVGLHAGLSFDYEVRGRQLAIGQLDHEIETYEKTCNGLRDHKYKLIAAGADPAAVHAVKLAKNTQKLRIAAFKSHRRQIANPKYLAKIAHNFKSYLTYYRPLINSSLEYAQDLLGSVAESQATRK